MNSKMFFDLDVSFEDFSDSISSIVCKDNLELEVVYYVSVFVPDSMNVCGSGKKCVESCKEKEGFPDSFCGLKWVKTMPFIMHNFQNIGEKIEKLFSDVIVSVSYTVVDLFCDSDGVAFNNTFCICMHKDVFSENVRT